MDIVQRFIDENCVTGDLYTIKIGDLYQRFCSWCFKNGDKPMTGIKFGKKLREKGFKQHKEQFARYWKGIGVYTVR